MGSGGWGSEQTVLDFESWGEEWNGGNMGDEENNSELTKTRRRRTYTTWADGTITRMGTTGVHGSAQTLRHAQTAGGAAFVFLARASAYVRARMSTPGTLGTREDKAHRIEELHRHLDVRRLPGDNNEPLAFTPCGGRRAVHPNAHRAGLHYLDLARAHVPDLINLRAALPDDTPDEVVRDVDLLCLELLLRRRGCTAVWVVRRGGSVTRDVG